MKILDYFRSRSKTTAVTAKERLQIIVAHERQDRTKPDYVEKMEAEIIAVIRKYVKVSSDDVSVSLDSSGSCSILELNVTLPDSEAELRNISQP